MTQEVKLKRSQCNYQAETARFLLECDFSKQYSHYYQKRFEKTKPIIKFNCESKWGANIPIYTLAKLAEVAPLYDLQEQSILNQSSLNTRRRYSLSISPESPRSGSQSSYELSKRLRANDYQSSPIDSQPVSSTQHNQTPVSKPSPIVEPIESPILGPDHILNQSQQESHPGLCIIVGTIFKRMRLQPDVVEELSRGDFHVKCERYLGHYASPDDQLVLEDTEESIALTGNIKSGEFVTGIVVGLLGQPMDECSKFYVHDICYAEPNYQLIYDDEDEDIMQETKIQPIEKPLSAEPIYLLVISGLGFTYDMEKQSNLTVALQGLIDFIWGGGRFEDDERSSKVSRILVVGDNLSEERTNPCKNGTPPADEVYLAGPSSGSNDQINNIALKMREVRQVKPYVETVQSVKHLDDFFAELSKTIAVDVMPGNSDPSSHLMPQQPFHPCMFPKSCMFPTFTCTTNPYHAIYDDHVEVMATSGQNVDIVSKFSSLSDPIEVMKKHLLWGSCAPSAPDNLYSVPYEEEDPYVIDFIPDIYIAGCQEYYQTEYYQYKNVSDDSPLIKSDEINSYELGHVKVETEIFNKSVEQKPQEIESMKSSPVNQTGAGSWRPNKKDRTLLMTVPKFCETYTCVLINLKNLNCELLSFD